MEEDQKRLSPIFVDVNLDSQRSTANQAPIHNVYPDSSNGYNERDDTDFLNNSVLRSLSLPQHFDSNSLRRSHEPKFRPVIARSEDSKERLWRTSTSTTNSNDNMYIEPKAGVYKYKVPRSVLVLLVIMSVCLFFMMIANVISTVFTVINAYSVVSSKANGSVILHDITKPQNDIIKCNDGTENCYSNAYATKLLTQDGIIIVSSGHCHDQQGRTCTSFQGIHRKVLDHPYGVRTLNGNSSCNVHITGGTEIGHNLPDNEFSSQNGWMLNIRHYLAEGICTTAYIKTNFIPILNGTLNKKQAMYCGPGDVFYLEVTSEISHNQRWNVNYATGCSQDAVILNKKLAFGPDYNKWG